MQTRIKGWSDFHHQGLSTKGLLEKGNVRGKGRSTNHDQVQAQVSEDDAHQ